MAVFKRELFDGWLGLLLSTLICPDLPPRVNLFSKISYASRAFHLISVIAVSNSYDGIDIKR
jgi:hypothetical protein